MGNTSDVVSLFDHIYNVESEGYCVYEYILIQKGEN